MKSVLLMLTMVMALVGCSTVPPAATAKRVTVLVENQFGSGTGVVISDKCVVTAAHVTGNFDNTITTDGGQKFKVAVQPTTGDADVAVICADEALGIKPVVFADKMPEQYTSVYAFGYPLHTPKFFSAGLYEGGDAMSVPVAPGMSGGGVYDASGRLIGLVDNHEIYPSEFGVLAYGYLSHMVVVADVVAAIRSAHIPGV